MSDPQTFEELRRMARELPKNVLVPAQHIHSLLEETFGMIERIADLKRRLEEAQQRNAAHDAKVAAEAKAEALEEFMENYHGKYAERTATSIADEMIAEYRDKAGMKP